MRTLFLVNDRTDLTAYQSTTAMALETVRRHARAFLAGIDDVSLDADGRVLFDALTLEDPSLDPDRVGEHLAELRASEVAASEVDVLLIRTNPGRDKARTAIHEATLNLCRLAATEGVLVLNDPAALPKASDKLFLTYLPERLRPRMVVSRDPGRLRQFVEAQKGSSVLKPLFGTRGHGVFRVRPGGENLAALLEILTNDGYVIAQEYLKRATEGDIRVITLDGRALEVDGKLCAVRRVPSQGEFRSNIFLGGHPAPAEASPQVVRAAHQVAEVLAENGIWMAGVDLVGTRTVEVNVRSPGGFVHAQGFERVDFVSAVMDSIEDKLSS